MRILALVALLLPLAAAAHPDHGPHWHASEITGFLALAAVAAGSLAAARRLEKRGA